MKPMKVEAILEIPPKTSYSSNIKHPNMAPNPGQNTLSMANGIGVTKNSKLGPMGPKCNLLKQTAPANTREYYGTKVLGVSNQKTKPLSHSPSVEPTVGRIIICIWDPPTQPSSEGWRVPSRFPQI